MDVDIGLWYCFQYLSSIILCGLFSLFVGVALALDLGLLTKVKSVVWSGNRRSYVVDTIKEEKDVEKKREKGKDDNIDLNKTKSEKTSPSDQTPKDFLSRDSARTKYGAEDDTQKSTTFKHVLHWTIVWISLAIVFAGIIYVMQGYENALLFLT